MNERQARLLTVLSAVLLVLVAVLVLAKPPKDKSSDGETWEPAFGSAVDATAVTAIDITAGSGPLRIERNEGEWRLTAPFDGAADERKAGDLLRAVSELEVGPALDVGSESLASFGLDTPVVVRLDRGEALPLTVRVGKDAPVGTRTYVQVGDDPSVHVSRERLHAAVAMGPDELRDPAIARFDRSEVKRIEIGNPPRVVLHEDELGWWVSNGADGELRADEQRVRSFLQDVLDVRADEFPAASAWEGRTALETLAISLWLGDATEPVHVEVDRWGPEEWSASGPAQSAPVRVHLSPLPGLSLDVDPWTSTAMLNVRDAQLTAVRVHTARTSFESTRSDAAWQPAAGGSVVSALAASRVDRSRRLALPQGEATGSIELEEDGHRHQTLTIFAPLENGDVPARDRDGGPVFAVSGSQLAAIESAASAAVPSATAPSATMEPAPSH